MNIENRNELTTCRIDFEKHIQDSIVFPEISGFENRFINVPVLIQISSQGALDYAKYKKLKNHPGLPWVGDDQTDYINEALRIINLFKDWIPHLINGTYQETIVSKSILFHYHKSLLSDNNIILNPSKRAQCLDNTWRTQRTIQNVNGCDGMGRVLAIINEAGIPEDLEVYNVTGKTNNQIIEGNFKALGKWSPAKLNGESVKSQINLDIYD